MTREERCGERGMGLVEVLIAAVVGIGIIAAVGTFLSGALKASSTVTDLTTWNALAQRAQTALNDGASCAASVRTMRTFRPTGFAALTSVPIEIRGPSNSLIAGPPFPRKLGGKLTLDTVLATPFSNGPGRFLVRIDLDGTLKTQSAAPASARYAPPTTLNAPFPEKSTFSSFIVAVSFGPTPGAVSCTPQAVQELQTQLTSSNSSLQAQVATLQAQINALQAQVAALSGQVASTPRSRGPEPYFDAGFYWHKNNGQTDGPRCILKNTYTNDCTCPSGSSLVHTHATSLFNQWTTSYYCRWN